MSDDTEFPIPSSAYEARQWLTPLAQQLDRQGIAMREPPDEPTSCCGRGCNGCVWEGYLTAVGYWCKQAREKLAMTGSQS